MSRLEQLLRASVSILHQRQRIAALEEENALLAAQLRIANLKLERRLEASAHLPDVLQTPSRMIL
jgi:sensor histidine kinase YesM